MLYTLWQITFRKANRHPSLMITVRVCFTMLCWYQAYHCTASTGSSHAVTQYLLEQYVSREASLLVEDQTKLSGQLPRRKIYGNSRIIGGNLLYRTTFRSTGQCSKLRRTCVLSFRASVSYISTLPSAGAFSVLKILYLIHFCSPTYHLSHSAILSTCD